MTIVKVAFPSSMCSVSRVRRGAMSVLLTRTGGSLSGRFSGTRRCAAYCATGQQRVGGGNAGEGGRERYLFKLLL